uniref:Putative restriction endonuclease domain-containing protein n=1 Tax=Thermosporothrix sp. COM3 TaxID=2490863 RepID=A0A455SGW5_9CHLR|nr:hypothetical protein KTC_01260 [Thermosporothrix sp. COM3]
MTQQHSSPVPQHGIPMTRVAFERLLSDESHYRYELVDYDPVLDQGTVLDMTGSSPEHAELSYNVTEAFKMQLGKRGPCRVYQEQYVEIPGQPSSVPDVVVTCDPGDREKDKRARPFRVRSPLIIVKVLSPSTEKYDRTEKFLRYTQCPTLGVYLLVSQDEPYIEVYRRSTNWKQERYSSGQTIHLDQLDLELVVDEVYEGVF